MIKYKNKPKYGDIKKNKIRFALFPIKIETKDNMAWIWLERYRKCYEYTRSFRCDLQDYWRFTGYEVITNKEKNYE